MSDRNKAGHDALNRYTYMHLTTATVRWIGNVQRFLGNILQTILVNPGREEFGLKVNPKKRNLGVNRRTMAPTNSV